MNDTAVLEDLVAQERAAMDPYFADSDPAAYVALFADEATYFDPNTPGRVEDEAIAKHFAGYAGEIPPWRYEVLNPEVTVRGDTAVFTFNLVTFDRDDGSVTSRWNTTEVHARSGDAWRIVHAHWSHTEPGG